MKLKELLQHVHVVHMSADPETEVSGICYDSRKLSAGNVFVAVKGLTSDGHDYICWAGEYGAAAVICEKVCESDVPYVLVNDSREALALISAAWFRYPAEAMKVLGVTGTSGKTTSTHLIRHILKSALQTKVGLIGTNGNYIGDEYIHTEFTTPDSYELQGLFRKMADEGCSFAVMEVSSHSLALERVVGITFDVAAFTNLSQDHLDFHGTMDAYAKEKKKLFSMCKAACINIDDAYGRYMMKDVSCPVLTSSAENCEAELRAEEIRLTESSVHFKVKYRNESVDVVLSIPGLFSVYNALTAISVCLKAGVTLQQSADALSSAKGVKGRVETVPVEKDYTVIIDYSHKPDALENVLKTLRPLAKNRLVVLFGCGGDRDHEKRPIMGSVAADNADFVIVTSDNPRTEKPEDIITDIVAGLRSKNTPFRVICDRIEAIHWTLDNAEPGDVILLAGKGHEDYQIIGHEKHHMDEREIVADYLKEKSHL